MNIKLLASTITGIYVGAFLVREAYRVRIHDLHLIHEAEVDHVFQDAFSRGWNAACNDTTVVKENYTKLFNSAN